MIALATPSPAEGWIEFYRRLNKAAAASIDTGIPDPEFGFYIGGRRATHTPSTRWVSITVPPGAALDGFVAVSGGVRHSIRNMGGTFIATVTHDDARELLRHPAWRDLNQQLAAELIPEGAP